MNEQNQNVQREGVRCTICLSVDRNLNPVGKLAEILRILLTNAELAISMDDISSIQICWECRATLHKALGLRERVCHAQQFLRLAKLYRTMNLPTSLSPLKVSHKQNYDYEFTHKEEDKLMDSDVDPFKDINSEDVPQECINSEKAPKDYIKLEKIRDSSEDPQEYFDQMENDESQDIFDKQCPEVKLVPLSPGGESSPVTAGSRETALKQTIAIAKKSLICNTCKGTYSCLSALKVHMRVHTGEKPFSCTTCDAKFNHVSNLNKHKRIHTGEKPFSCTTCDAKFVQRANLKVHMRIHTGEKPFNCTICDAKFTRASFLNSHIVIHTGVKPFSCTLCNKKFTQITYLKAHVLIHTGLVPSM